MGNRDENSKDAKQKNHNLPLKINCDEKSTATKNLNIGHNLNKRKILNCTKMFEKRTLHFN